MWTPSLIIVLVIARSVVTCWKAVAALDWESEKRYNAIWKTNHRYGQKVYQGRNEEMRGEKPGLMMKKGSMLPILGFALVGLLLVSDRSYGFKQEDLDKLAATGQCLFCDLSQADLSAADLSSKKLTGARLPDANLSDAKLSNTNLRNAYLSRAKLTNANLSGADLSGADLPDAQLRGANLSGANLSHANLPKAILSNADLSHTRLLGADLSSADLTGADISTADFSGATWPDGKKCGAGSLGECKKDTSRSDQRPTGGRGSRGSSGMGMGR